MHLRNAEIFCDVAAFRSISRAAEVHHVSQPSASQAVSQLEKDLAVQLIDRSRRPLELTPAGQKCYEGFRELLGLYRQIRDQVHGLKDVVSGRVRVASIYSVGLLQLDACVREFERAWPSIEVQVDYLHPDSVYQRISDDETDFGLVSFPQHGGEFASIPWREHSLVLVVPPGHRLAEYSDGIAPELLEDEDFVAFTTELTIRRRIDRWLKQARIAVNVMHEFDNIENIKRGVEAGTGVSLLPRPAVEREVRSGSLVAVPVCGVNWTRPLGIVHRRHKSLSRAATLFVEFLQNYPEPELAGSPQPAQQTVPAAETAPEPDPARTAAATDRTAAVPAANTSPVASVDPSAGQAEHTGQVEPGGPHAARHLSGRRARS